MSRISIFAMVAVLSMCSMSLAIEPAGISAYGNSGDIWNVPASPGLRFTAAPTSVLTGGHGYYGGADGMDVWNGGCGCANGYCVDWKLLPWTASWGDPYGHHGHHQGGCSTCGN